jgi:hypothetical protein
MHRSARIEVQDRGTYATATLVLDGQKVLQAAAKSAESARVLALDGWADEMRRAAVLVPDDAPYPW